mmetsp:Transcript_83026/g.221828  ORF Transcript_83026/g.221828 Transcript_83026/m.221828 type:complete len:360 (+) Transcript_83026:284-1363(+)
MQVQRHQRPQRPHGRLYQPAVLPTQQALHGGIRVIHVREPACGEIHRSAHAYNGAVPPKEADTSSPHPGEQRHSHLAWATPIDPGLPCCDLHGGAQLVQHPGSIGQASQSLGFLGQGCGEAWLALLQPLKSASEKLSHRYLTLCLLVEVFRGARGVGGRLDEPLESAFADPRPEATGGEPVQGSEETLGTDLHVFHALPSPSVVSPAAGFRRQRLIGIGQLLKTLFRLGIVRIFVRMVLLGLLHEGLPHFRCHCVLRQSKYLIVSSVFNLPLLAGRRFAPLLPQLGRLRRQTVAVHDPVLLFVVPDVPACNSSYRPWCSDDTSEQLDGAGHHTDEHHCPSRKRSQAKAFDRPLHLALLV